MAHAAHATAPDITDWLTRIRAEYLEMPGLNPTLGQAQRLWSVDAAILGEVFARLTAAHFLRQTDNGTYVREEGR